MHKFTSDVLLRGHVRRGYSGIIGAVLHYAASNDIPNDVMCPLLIHGLHSLHRLHSLHCPLPCLAG